MSSGLTLHGPVTPEDSCLPALLSPHYSTSDEISKV